MDQNETIRLNLDASGVQEGSKKGAKALDDLGEVAEKTSKKGGNAAQSLLQLGRGVQDFAAAGIGGITNNIEGLASSLGLGAGLAGAATVAGVAIQFLGPSVMRFIQSISGQKVVDFRTEIEKLTEEVKELEDRPRKSILDIQELDAARKGVKELKDGLEAYYALQDKRTAGEKKAGSRLEAELTEAVGGGPGFTQIENTIAEGRARARAAADPEIQRRREQERAAAAKAEEFEEAKDFLHATGERNKQARFKAEANALEGKILTDERTKLGGTFAKAFAGGAPDVEALAKTLEEGGRKDLAALARRNDPKILKQTEDLDKFQAQEAADYATKQKAEEKAQQERQKYNLDIQKFTNEQFGRQKAANARDEAAQDRIDEGKAAVQRSVNEDRLRQLGGTSGIEQYLVEAQQRGFSGDRAQRMAELEAARGARTALGLGRGDAQDFARFAVNAASISLGAKGFENTNTETGALRQALDRATQVNERLANTNEELMRRGAPVVLRRGRRR